jgi:uncharacterized protein with FMN-binding domain
VGGLALLLGFRSPQEATAEVVVAIDTGTGRVRTPESLAPAPGLDASPSLDTGVAPGASASQEPGAPSEAPPSAGASPSATASPSPTQTPEPTPGTKTATGNAYQHPFGVVQVAVTVEGGQIVDVQALRMPGGDQRSAWISQQVEPMLRESALAANSAKINIVSGATYTSTAYAYSLQSALDQLAS